MITAADFKAIPRGGRYTDPTGAEPEEPFAKARFYREGKKRGVVWGLGPDEDVRDTVQRVASQIGLVVQYVTSDDFKDDSTPEVWRNVAPDPNVSRILDSTVTKSANGCIGFVLICVCRSLCYPFADGWTCPSCQRKLTRPCTWVPGTCEEVSECVSHGGSAAKRRLAGARVESPHP